MELGLGSNSLHLLFLFPRQSDLGPGSGFADWENPRLPHQLTAEKQESHFPGGSTQMETSQIHSCFSGVEKLPVS